MPFTLTGIAVSRGIAIGRAHLIAPAPIEVRHYLVEPDKTEVEVSRLQAAIEEVRDELVSLRGNLPKDAPEEMAAFLDVHAMFLKDEMIAEAPAELIRLRSYNAEWALTHQLEELVRQFDEIGDAYLCERKADVVQVVDRVLKALAGARPDLPIVSADQDAPMIVVAHDISPADMLKFKDRAFAGFATDLGGKTSHTAIVARSLDIPAAVGLVNASALIRQDDWLIVDGDSGTVIVNPTPIVLDEYRDRQSPHQLQLKKLQRLRFAPTQTLDGVPIALEANIELPEDAPHALESGAVGIGLFRSEFLFMNRKGDLPGEEEQFGAYRSVVESMRGLPVTIRTVDVGADKPLDADMPGNQTSALGLRAIRWSLSDPQMFLTQLRALLRASAFGKVRILLPMLAHSKEIDQTLDLLERARAELDQEGLPYDPNVEVGAMIEIPAAALALPMFLRRLNFLSVGTNDLIQYTLAVDRADGAVAHLYDPLHPAVLNLIARTIHEAKQAGLPVAVCGEMAGDPTMTRLLLGMGLTEFSLHPIQLLAVKQEILHADAARLSKVVDRLLAACEPEELQAELESLRAA
ncbi:MAG: phosphoenolpyruvate--protein phosphotransferase [Candidatus Protistobacter heckmanni]|nr:phosphoenolpyruvate--protein phosphotransferase [Candidatus Protistobacter heckmanni]